MNTILEKFYKDHQVKPFISPERDLDAWLLNPKPVSKRNMELLTKLSKSNPMHCFKEFFSCLTIEGFY